MKLFYSIILLSLFISGSAKSANEITSHQAIYDISLESTTGGASSVVNAKGKMKYSIQKICNAWQTESVFSLDVGYELIGLDTTLFQQKTTESTDGCHFDFEVFVRENNQDRKDFAGKVHCDKNKKIAQITVPVKSTATLPKNVTHPVQQTIQLIQAAKTGKKSASAYLYDGTRPESLYFMNALISSIQQKPATEIKGDSFLLKDKKSYRFDTAFFDSFKTKNTSDGKPEYEVSMSYYENGISDDISQDFGHYQIKSKLIELKQLKELPCVIKK